MKLSSMLVVAAVAAGSVSFLNVSPAPAAFEPAAQKAAPAPKIQVALLLDTSNSMDGLIDQARTQLWSIVNELSAARHDGRPPTLEVALYEYGNNGLPAAEGYVRLVQPFTSDLDLLGEKLWSLKTNGGSEFCGTVIADATQALNWDPADVIDGGADKNDHRPAVYRTIFIAGNEPFTQGEVDYRRAVPAARGKGIVVNTIHCGSPADGESGEWMAGARLGGGEFLNIDQDRRTVVMATPFDEEITDLGRAVNTTYIGFGRRAEAAMELQTSQDKLAEANADVGSAVQRAVAKSSALYDNRGWDLVDATKAGELELDNLDRTQLPEPLANLSDEELKAKVAKAAGERERIQKRIAELQQQRAAFLAENQKPAEGEAATLDTAIVAAVRKQLAENGFDTPAAE
ncbi:MAG: VWA domain-containing protein [Phycisphaerae bacterium]